MCGRQQAGSGGVRLVHGHPLAARGGSVEKGPPGPGVEEPEDGIAPAKTRTSLAMSLGHQRA